MDNHPVRMKSSFWFNLMTLVLFVPGVVSCDKVTTVMAKLVKPTTPTAPGAPASEDAAATSLPETPVAKSAYRRDQVSEITPAAYPSFIAKSNALVLVDFHAEWCAPCRMLGPVLAQAAEENPGVVYVGKMNVDQAGDFPGSLGVRGIPDVRIFKGGKEVDRFVGFPGKNEVLEKIARHAKGIEASPVAETPPVAPVQAQSAPAVKPFSKGWLPPGMSRASEATVPPKP
jgi:thioredoxin 1